MRKAPSIEQLLINNRKIQSCQCPQDIRDFREFSNSNQRESLKSVYILGIFIKPTLSSGGPPPGIFIGLSQLLRQYSYFSSSFCVSICTFVLAFTPTHTSRYPTNLSSAYALKQAHSKPLDFLHMLLIRHYCYFSSLLGCGRVNLRLSQHALFGVACSTQQSMRVA